MKKLSQKAHSLFFVLLVSFIVCSWLLLGFITIILLPSTSRLLVQNAISRTQETVLQSASSVDIYVDQLLGTMNYTSSTITDLYGKNNAKWQGQIYYLKDSNNDITEVAVFSSTGALLFTTGGELNGNQQSIAAADWFRKALLWQGASTYFSSPHVQNLFGDQRNFVITLTRAFYYYDETGNQQTGVLLMDVYYSAFEALIKDTRLSKSGYLYIVDENNQIILHPSIQMIYAGLLSEDATAVDQQVLGITNDTDKDRSRTLIIASLSNTRWRMVGVAYVNEIFSLQNDLRRLIYGVLIGAALLSFIPAVLIAHNVTKPILHLEHKMQKVEAGDLSVSVSERSFTEIRLVSVAFNHMLARIRLLMDQVIQEQEKKRLNELNALQAQINPHFLYNTLDSIIWMEERGKSREAITMVSALARLFRISISKGRTIIFVYEEIEHVRNYLIIQKMRFKENFTYEIRMDEEARNVRTLKLIIQPLVENSISHGLDHTDFKELHIFISAEVDDQFLYFTVRDDGVGIPKEKADRLLDTPAGKSGIGLKNVHERIQLICGSDYGLTITSVEGEGTTIHIRMPRNLEVTE